MLLSKAIQLLGLGISLTASVYASEQPAAIITSDHNIQLIQSYKTAVNLSDGALKLLSLVSEALSYIVSPNAGEFDAAFQAEKYGIEKEMKKFKLSMRVIGSSGDTTIYIHNDGNNNHLKFDLSGTNIPLSMASTSLSTTEKASMALTLLREIRDSMDKALPSDSDSESLEKFTTLDEPVLNKSATQISFAHNEDGVALIRSLVELKQYVDYDLNSLINLAKLAAREGQTDEELSILNGEYQTKLEYFFIDLLGGRNQLNTDISIFNDVTLSFDFKKTRKEYFFPKIDLAAFGLDTDNLLDVYADAKAFMDVIHLYAWVEAWLISGNTLVADIEVQQDDVFKSLSALKLSPEHTRLIMKQVKNLH